MLRRVVVVVGPVRVCEWAARGRCAGGARAAERSADSAMAVFVIEGCAVGASRTELPNAVL